ncbi:FAD:protein FMN transferase [Mesoterricola sediminis]|uniref:FAD:protein FMN transferase n=2 Tax=Mesoterricola sediminis TaxID=2927980 RepID=A0AA48H1L1_9BACT|nr:FAD:protein FMN transferase [Mesoterricola sediminis]
MMPPALQPPHPVDRTVLAMGTRLTLADLPPAAAEAALAEVARIEAACSTWRPDSAWSRANGAGEAWTPLDGAWLDLLRLARAWSERTEGAFDPVLGTLVAAWGLRTGGARPGPAELAAARAASGIARLEVGPTAIRLTGGAQLEEGGFLKGYALDRARAEAQARGAARGLLDFGGQLLAWGGAWPADIADPRDRSRARVRLRLVDASLSTSGCAERGRHLLDPRTGRPCPDWGAVAVVAPGGLEADILSTALYVLGPRAGLAWAERNGVAALFLGHGAPPRASRAFQALHPIYLKEAP